MAKILIVDDDHDLVETMRLVLEKNEFTVAAAHNRPDGIAAVEAEKPDLIILDVMMEQDDDGFVVAQTLRKKGINTPIIMLTNINKAMGFTFGKDAEMVPVNEFLEKPIDPIKLLGKVKELLG